MVKGFGHDHIKRKKSYSVMTWGLMGGPLTSRDGAPSEDPIKYPPDLTEVHLYESSA